MYVVLLQTLKTDPIFLFISIEENYFDKSPFGNENI